MLPFLDEKRATEAVLTRLNKNGQLENVEPEERSVDLDRDGMRLAANDVMNAFSSKDETKFLSAMKALIQLLSDKE